MSVTSAFLFLVGISGLAAVADPVARLLRLGRLGRYVRGCGTRAGLDAADQPALLVDDPIHCIRRRALFHVAAGAADRAFATHTLRAATMTHAARLPLGRVTMLALAAATLIGCQSNARPDLERLYRTARADVRQPPVVLIHGVMGSKLRDTATGLEAWPGSIARLALSDHRDLGLDIDPRTLEPLPSKLEPYELTDAVAGLDFYRSILQVLERAGRYELTEIGTRRSVDQRSYYVFLYDWRQDNQKSAAKLAAFIDQIRVDHADPQLEVDIIAHSMGGLIARYYIRYGATDVLDTNDFPVNSYGASRVRRLVLLGTPNLGSISAVQSFIDGRRLGLRRIPTEALMTMPSLYQMFPHAINDWLITLHGKPLERDIFDVRLWQRFQWSIFDKKVATRIAADRSPEDAAAHLSTLTAYFEKRLERARRFLWSLTVPVERAVPLIVFGGDCELTPARLLVEEIAGESVLRLWPNEISGRLPNVDYDALMLEPGDGTVTKASLLARSVLDPSVARHRYSYFPLAYSIFLCEPHETLTANVTFQDNLLHALLSADEVGDTATITQQTSPSH